MFSDSKARGDGKLAKNMSFKGKTYSKKGGTSSKHANPFDRMMKEQCNKVNAQNLHSSVICFYNLYCYSVSLCTVSVDNVTSFPDLLENLMWQSL